MSEITVTFADGAVERFPAGVTAGDVLRAHAERNASGRKELKRAIAACIESGEGVRVLDLGRALGEDCRVSAVLPESAEGLEVLRHSTAHLMAQAITRLYQIGRAHV